MKEKATKVDCLGWAGTKVSMFSSLGALTALYVLLKMREGVKEKATKVDCLGWARTKVRMSLLLVLWWRCTVHTAEVEGGG